MFSFDLGSGNKLKILERHHTVALFTLTDSCRDYLREWLPWVDNNLTVYETEKFIDFTRAQFANNNCLHAGIWCGEELVGSIGFHTINWNNKSCSLGYWLSDKFQGRGLMTESCRAFINHAFHQYKLNRVEIRCGVGNKKSQAIAERLGFKLEGTIRHAEILSGERVIDHSIYGLLASEWK